MQVELAQVPLIDCDIAGNTQIVLDAIAKADVAGGTKLIVFPETTLSGFPTRDTVADIAQTIDGPALSAVRQAARAHRVAVVVGLAERDELHGEAVFYNTSVLIDEQGEIVLRYRKTHLWASDVGVFTPGDHFPTCVWNGITVGVLICYDIEFPETARALASQGIDLLIVTNGNMAPYGPVHRRAITARAMENQMFALLVNRCGSGDDDLTFVGESALLDSNGDVVAEIDNDRPAILKTQIDWSQLTSSRQHYRYLRDARVPLQLTQAVGEDGSPALAIAPSPSVGTVALASAAAAPATGTVH